MPHYRKTLVSVIAAAVAAVWAFPTSLGDHPSTRAAEAGKSKSVPFPTDKTFGSVYAVSPQGNSRWLADACGTVTIPAGNEVELRVTVPFAVRNLPKLPPNSIQSLVLDLPIRVGYVNLTPLKKVAGLKRVDLSMSSLGPDQLSMPVTPTLEKLKVIAVTDGWIRSMEGYKSLKEFRIRRPITLTNVGLNLLTKIPTLQSLDICEKHLTPECMGYLMRFPNLRALGVRKITFGRDTPPLAVLNQLKGLQHIEVSLRGDDGKWWPQLGSLKALRELTITGEFTDEAFGCVKSLKGLQKLSLLGEGNVAQELRLGDPALQKLWKDLPITIDAGEVDDAALIALQNYKGIRSIRALPTNVSQKGLSALAKLPALETLDFQDSPLKESALAGLVGSKQLRVLILKLSGTIDGSGLAQLKKLPALYRVELDLSGTQIRPGALAKLNGLNGLTDLNLNGAKMTDTALAGLTHLPRINRVNLSKTPVSAKTIAVVSGWGYLKELDLNSTPISASVLPTLAKLKQLRHLSLNDTSLGDDAGDELVGLIRKSPNIHFHLAGNSLSRATRTQIKQEMKAVDGVRYPTDTGTE